MRESRTYGSVRGARGNSRPYREEGCLLRLLAPAFWHEVTLRCSAAATAGVEGTADLSIFSMEQVLLILSRHKPD
jgi:hypothetical protein